jgi:arylsulfatase A
MNEKYKLYQDGRFYNTFIDPLEENPLLRYSGEEEKHLRKFELILKEKEKDIPFELNDAEFKNQK